MTKDADARLTVQPRRLLAEAVAMLALRPSPRVDGLPWFDHCGISHGENRPDCVICEWLFRAHVELAGGITPKPADDAWVAMMNEMHAVLDQGHMRSFGIVLHHRPMIEAALLLERGPWLHYTTHQVACPVGPWQTKLNADPYSRAGRDSDDWCTCGYTLLVDRAIAAGAS